MREVIIEAAVVIAVMGVVYAVAYLRGSRKSGNIANIAKEVDTLSPLLQPVVTYIEGKLPAPLQAKAVQITGVIGQAVTLAENMWKDGLLTEDSRKAYATSAIQWGLSLAGVKPGEASEKLIGTAVDLAVGLFLPPSHAASAAGGTTAVPAKA